MQLGGPGVRTCGPPDPRVLAPPRRESDVYDMPTLGSVFLFLAVLGGALVAFQAVGSVIGMGHDAGDGDVTPHAEIDHDSALSAFNFRSIRAIATGICF